MMWFIPARLPPEIARSGDLQITSISYERPLLAERASKRKCEILNEQQIPAASVPAQPLTDASHLPARIEMLSQGRIPFDLDISADGKRVAFMVAEYVPGEQKLRSRIWVTETENAEAR